ncbi:hypothetical protein FOZ61_011005, partial [Perkinsus olseni]
MIPGWVVKLVIEAEVDEEDLNGQIIWRRYNANGSRTSLPLPAQLSVASSFDLLRIITLESAFIKPSSVSGIVDSTVNDVNQHGGCDLVIWNKASQGQGENDTGIKPPKNHLVRLSPSKLPDDVRAQIMNRRYNGEPEQQPAASRPTTAMGNNRNTQQGNNRNDQQGNNRNTQQGNNRNDQQGNNRNTQQGNNRNDQQGNNNNGQQGNNQVHLDVIKGRIVECRVFTDALYPDVIGMLEEALRGGYELSSSSWPVINRYSAESIREALESTVVFGRTAAGEGGEILLKRYVEYTYRRYVVATGWKHVLRCRRNQPPDEVFLPGNHARMKAGWKRIFNADSVTLLNNTADGTRLVANAAFDSEFRK